VNPQLAAISQIAVTTETECLKLPNKTEKDCEKAKNDAIVDTIKGLCKEDKACIQAIADGLKNGTVPLSAPVFLFCFLFTLIRELILPTSWIMF
jgi:hypothetical protein